MSPVKETNYFTRDLIGREGPGDREFIPFIDRAIIKSLIEKKKVLYSSIISDIEDYKYLFLAGSKSIARGEISPSYLYYSSYSAKRIRTLLPECKILIILRNPINRAISNWKAMVAWGREWLPFAKAIKECEKRINNKWEHFWDYLGLGNYYKQIIPFMEIFPEDQLKTLLYEDLILSPQKAFDEICDFIEVNRCNISNNSYNSSPTLINKTDLVFNRLRKINLKCGLARKIYIKFSEKIYKNYKKFIYVNNAEKKELLKYYEKDIYNLEKIFPILKISRWYEEER
jgi:predicted DNA-binding antitoxin AbrB/MazE fold protein